MPERDYFELSTLFKTLLKGMAHKWNQHGCPLTQTQFKTLFVLSKEGPQMVSQLAHALDLTSAAITGVTDHLLAEGYVKKERAEGDRRVVNITLTEEGASLIKEVEKSQKELLHSHFSVLPDEDIAHLKRIFNTLIAELDKK